MNYNLVIYKQKDKLTYLNTPNFANIYLVISGDISFQKLNSKYTFHQGEVFIVYDFEENLILSGQTTMACISVNNLTYHRFSLSYRENTSDNYPIPKVITETYIETLKAILEENYFDADIGVIKLINYLNHSKDNLYVNMSYSNKLIKDIVEYINKNYKKPLTLSCISKKFYVNSSYLSREFSRKMNISLIKYIKKVKIYSLSRELLLHGNWESTWKAYGFRSYNTYLRDFKNIMHMSPKEYVQQSTTNQVNEKIEPDELYIQLQQILDSMPNE
ncbi:helix-turn-helix domain-containing protein [Staphylococcus sp. GSSP0090]|nr:helix-turn-helix domain-containing protein [Staphylococcus sp. GSSP0090]